MNPSHNATEYHHGTVTRGRGKDAYHGGKMVGNDEFVIVEEVREYNKGKLADAKIKVMPRAQ